ncbi:hypothetical protein PV08_00189 [Exophiala spinifera]|uniref:Major facilitator superfamily (MFS) profile domain-containing protein n=1 Tax=Exophiala spinifera TaxID=91928 RepID=A0A0D1YWF3_9EURO|nr:uncharacterized protein PV08_00189 [Exophiala spinifera]KIW19616.1 hypothetical protein PV08_00189 [Exophiala spinifera]
MVSNQPERRSKTIEPSNIEVVLPSHRREDETRLTRKLDFRLVPALYLLCLVAFMDKIAIGNARIQGLEQSVLDPGSNEYNVVISLYWIPYILAQIPSNILMKLIPPPIYLSTITALFGIVTVCQGFVHSYGSLVVCRCLLGLFEAGISPGSVYLLTMYYPRWELQKRFAIIWTNGFVAGASSGLLAFALAKMDGLGGLAGWRWIFIVEGLVTIVVSGVAYFLLLDWPANTKGLTAVEREILKTKMKDDGEHARMDMLTHSAMRSIARDWKIYVGALQYCSISLSGATLSFFMPTIIKEFGYSSSMAQVFTIPVWTACAVVTIGVGWLSDHLRKRAVFIYLGCGVTTVAYILLVCQQHFSIGVKYMSIFIMGSGVFTMQPISVIWILSNLSGHYKRSVGSAAVLGFGSIGSIIASNIFLSREAPTFRTGYAVSFAFIGLEALLCTGYLLGLRRENRKRDSGERDWRLSLPQDEIDNLGDDHPEFRFCY